MNREQYDRGVCDYCDKKIDCLTPLYYVYDLQFCRECYKGVEEDFNKRYKKHNEQQG